VLIVWVLGIGVEEVEDVGGEVEKTPRDNTRYLTADSSRCTQIIYFSTKSE